MSRLKIAVYTMAKNEAAHVERYAETTREADIVVVTDTGSTDGTPDLLRDAKIDVHVANIVPWRFDVATNCALCHVPADVDVCVKLDLDEVIYSRDGTSWRAEIEQLWEMNVRQLQYWYTWSWLVPGKTPAVKFHSSNVHARSGFTWRHPGHAGLYSAEHGHTAHAQVFEIHHYMTNKSRPNYIPLLQLGVRENRCPRTLFYLGREYSLWKKHTECIETLTEYMAHPAAHWKAERANAMRLMAISHEALGDDPQALSWLIRAQAELPNVRDIWWELLRHFHDRSDYHGGFWAGIHCLGITERDGEWLGITGSAWNEDPYVLTAKCAWYSDHREDAIRFLQQAFNINPGSKLAREVAAKIGLDVT